MTSAPVSSGEDATSHRGAFRDMGGETIPPFAEILQTAADGRLETR